jgi:hypothetical protein
VRDTSVHFGDLPRVQGRVGRTSYNCKLSLHAACYVDDVEGDTEYPEPPPLSDVLGGYGGGVGRLIWILTDTSWRHIPAADLPNQRQCAAQASAKADAPGIAVDGIAQCPKWRFDKLRLINPPTVPRFTAWHARFNCKRFACSAEAYSHPPTTSNISVLETVLAGYTR